ncbi:MAG: geranylgeranylglycerol-phosphate geranylgeranyltransferase [Rhodothermales bacterium]|nr:geranylgeranylglycerol-phosphate geranylgeranyltransferase [Rhodothermales bacterium]
MFFAGTFVGGVMSAGRGAFTWPDNSALVLAALSATFVGASGNVLNDIKDVAIDRVNRPDRPLPRGQLGINAARVLWVVVTLGGLLTAVFVSVAHVVIATAAVALVTVYNIRLKSVPVVGNVVVSVVVATALIYGGLSLDGLTLAVPAALFAFLTTFAREMLKDVEDLSGDASGSVSTYAVVRGPRAAGRFAAAILLLTVGLTVIPFLALEYGGTYLTLVLVADVMMVAAAWNALGTEPAETAGAASRWTKVAMSVGLLALAVSRLSVG